MDSPKGCSRAPAFPPPNVPLAGYGRRACSAWGDDPFGVWRRRVRLPKQPSPSMPPSRHVREDSYESDTRGRSPVCAGRSRGVRRGSPPRVRHSREVRCVVTREAVHTVPSTREGRPWSTSSSLPEQLVLSSSPLTVVRSIGRRSAVWSEPWPHPRRDGEAASSPEGSVAVPVRHRRVVTAEAIRHRWMVRRVAAEAEKRLVPGELGRVDPSGPEQRPTTEAARRARVLAPHGAAGLSTGPPKRPVEDRYPHP